MGYLLPTKKKAEAVLRRILEEKSV